MRTVTRIERIGEWLGPIDPSYQWDKITGVHSRSAAEGRETIERMAAEPDGWRYSPSGFNSFEVVHIGMYDGWPFWEPTPTIGYIGPLDSVETTPFYNLSRHNCFKLEPAQSKGRTA